MKTLAIISAISLAAGHALAETLPVEPFPGVTHSTTCPDVRAGVVSKPFPTYPRSAILDGQTGWVIVDFDVLDDGSTSNIRVVASSPPGFFDAGVVETFSRWKYERNVARADCRSDVRFNLPK